MISFRPIELSDRELIESYTFCSKICNCDLSFANMYCWQPTFESAWAVVNGFLVIRFRINGGEELGYMQPIRCDGSHDFSAIVPQLAQDAHLHGQRLRIIGLTQEGCAALRESRPDSFAFYSDRNFEDYIYSREALEGLSGRKYQPKRNHINQFTKLYNYEFQPLTTSHFDGCMELCSRWREQRGESLDTSSPEVDSIGRAFESFEELGLLGGVILVDGRVVAFTYGSAINDTTFCTHIEKCDTSYAGIYSAINQLFAASLPHCFDTINREEDMGIEGLRKSKLSYHPTSTQQKHTAIYLHSHEAECRKLWREVFGDEDEFIDHFLQRYYSRQGMLSIVDTSSRHIAMLHIIPMQSEIGRIAYIYGVATHPQYRGHGYATKLMRAAMEIIKSDDYAAAALIPNEEWLKGYYSKFGFKSETPLTFSCADSFDFGTGETTRDKGMLCMLNGEHKIETLHLALYI